MRRHLSFAILIVLSALASAPAHAQFDRVVRVVRLTCAPGSELVSGRCYWTRARAKVVLQTPFCRAGGYAIESGPDLDNNGRLETGEVRRSSTYCTGLSARLVRPLAANESFQGQACPWGGSLYAYSPLSGNRGLIAYSLQCNLRIGATDPIPSELRTARSTGAHLDLGEATASLELEGNPSSATILAGPPATRAAEAAN